MVPAFRSARQQSGRQQRYTYLANAGGVRCIDMRGLLRCVVLARAGAYFAFAEIVLVLGDILPRLNTTMAADRNPPICRALRGLWTVSWEWNCCRTRIAVQLKC